MDEKEKGVWESFSILIALTRVWKEGDGTSTFTQEGKQIVNDACATFWSRFYGLYGSKVTFLTSLQHPEPTRKIISQITHTRTVFIPVFVVLQHVTIYVHILAFHTLQVLEEFGNLQKISQQSTEGNSTNCHIRRAFFIL